MKCSVSVTVQRAVNRIERYSTADFEHIMCTQTHANTVLNTHIFQRQIQSLWVLGKKASLVSKTGHLKEQSTADWATETRRRSHRKLQYMCITKRSSMIIYTMNISTKHTQKKKHGQTEQLMHINYQYVCQSAVNLEVGLSSNALQSQCYYEVGVHISGFVSPLMEDIGWSGTRTRLYLLHFGSHDGSKVDMECS